MAGKLSLCFAAFELEPRPKTECGDNSYRFEDTPGRHMSWSHASGTSGELPLGGLLGRLLGRLLSGFLLSHGACHLLSLINLSIRKNYVNDFLISPHPFLARAMERTVTAEARRTQRGRKNDGHELHECARMREPPFAIIRAIRGQCFDQISSACFARLR